VTDHDR